MGSLTVFEETPIFPLRTQTFADPFCDMKKAAHFFGVAPGNPPLGLQNGQIQEHWKLTSSWWLKFGIIKKEHPIESGVSFEPLKSLAGASE